MSAPALSVILITRNEADGIADCLRSVAFADEWIVVDQSSTDGTAEIARSMGARVEVTADWPGFGAQKNRALALATGRWVLSIDADERVTSELAAEIRRVVTAEAPGSPGAGAPSEGFSEAAAGYRLSRLSSFCGQWMRHGDWYPDRVLRLFLRDQGRFTDDRVHERLEVRGRVADLKGDLLHLTMPDLHDALDKLNRYSTGRAADLHARGRRGGLWAALSHGGWAFVRCYILKLGCLDGRLGFVLAVYVAETTYYRYLKLGMLSGGAPLGSRAAPE
jgi:glycosyltransferase involved in cell wall biosynthesis